MRYRRLYLDGYSYFLTIVTYERNPILTENIALLRESFKAAKTRFRFEINAIVVLPDHFHAIMTFDDAREYPRIIGFVKKYFTSRCDPKYYSHLLQSQSRIDQNYKPVWQKRFYEHTIRDEKDYRLRLDYIHYNPVKHGYVSQAKEWEYSSFRRFVNDGIYHISWGDFDTSIEL